MLPYKVGGGPAFSGGGGGVMTHTVWLSNHAVCKIGLNIWRLFSVLEERELSPDDKAINSLTVTIVSVSLVAVALVGALIYLLVFIIQRKQWVFHF